MRGHVEKVPNGWKVIVEAGRDPETGSRKRIVRSLRGRTRAEAFAVMNDLLSEMKHGIIVDPDRMTVADYLARWLESHLPNLAPSTQQSYEMIVRRHLVPALGSMPLASLHPLHIQNYYNKARDMLSARTVRYHHTVLREALKQAVRWRMLTSNPADLVQIPRARRPEMKALDVEGTLALLKDAEGHRDYPLIHTALYTGLRRGELVALKWADVDLERGTVTVRSSMIRLSGEFVFREPKTSKSRRQVKLSKASINLLKALRKGYLEARLRLGPDYHDNGLVFSNENGTPLDPGEASHRFSAIARAAGFSGLRFHDLRHTHATLLLAQGYHPKVVQERLGHENISTTLDIYSHVIPSLQDAVADRLDDILSGNGTETAPMSKNAACKGGDS